MREALGLRQGARISKEKLRELKTLPASERGIIDLAGLEEATGLTSLQLDKNEIEEYHTACRLDAAYRPES